MSENKTVGGDERLTKSAATPVRGDRAGADNERTQKDGTSLTMEERRRRMRSEWTQEVLPSPPVVPGWHFCWLSTTNSSDPIYKRVQKGYEPVKASEIAGWSDYKVQQGEFEGCVACNEMLLFKVPEEIYQDIMSYFHYELPMEEEEMLRENAQKAVDGQDNSGRELGDVEGYDNIVKRVRKPTFA
jgi:hypothetical protein